MMAVAWPGLPHGSRVPLARRRNDSPTVATAASARSHRGCLDRAVRPDAPASRAAKRCRPKISRHRADGGSAANRRASAAITSRWSETAGLPSAGAVGTGVRTSAGLGR